MTERRPTTQTMASPIADNTTGEIAIQAPEGRYYILRVRLKTDRVMAVVLPYGVDPKEATEIRDQLISITEIVEKWQ